MDDKDFMNESADIVNGSRYFYFDYNFNYEETQLEKALKWFETAFILPIGVLGNILVLCVLLKKKYRKSSTAVFLSSLAVSDIVILVSGFYNLMVLRTDSSIDCKITIPIWICSSQTSSCILATVAIERACFVTQPHKAKFIFTARCAKLIMVLETIIVYGLNALMLVKYELDEDNGFENMFCPTGEPVKSSIVHFVLYY
ncbi:thyrotropin-releasing hormone receptor-like [Ruditapes philippinarum]|uniref:thyrotropin-releasing hormone receptor-like n=1 Tax=Ruditapes philippinarum TaxID=129788 RepID=UPI00295BEAAD|nr:thyrotropin-releasing hormone receptor-like [Ruditapes philippinarum]